MGSLGAMRRGSRDRYFQDEAADESKLVPEAIFSTAKGFESFAAFDKAARFYELYASRYREQKTAPTQNGKSRSRSRGRND